jgi:hypothetical protein
MMNYVQAGASMQVTTKHIELKFAANLQFFQKIDPDISVTNFTQFQSLKLQTLVDSRLVV